VRDHLADCLVTLPALLARDASPSLHFWFASLEGMRLQIAPQLGRAYASWCAGGRSSVLRDVVAAGAAHWQLVCERILELHASRGSDAQEAIVAMARDEGVWL
jgi:hypothetical protein